MSKNSRSGLTSASFCLAVFVCLNSWSPTLAQTAPVSTPAGEGGLSEIVVTALRRETKLEDTPLAIAALSSEDIERQHIVDFADLQTSLPYFGFTQVTRQETFLSMRGTAVQNDTPGSDLGVSVFIDGVPRTGVHDYNPDLFDLQSIEVLRGPQGTLFGRNTTGGAVLIRTTAPSFTPTYTGQVTYGSENLVDVNALATGPVIADQVAAKIAVALHRRDGNVDNIVQGREDGAERTGSVRLQMLWQPRDDLKVLLSADYLRDRSESRIGTLEGTFAPALFPGLQFGPDVSNSAFTPRASNTIAGLAGTVDWATEAGTLTSITGFRSVTPRLTYAPLAEPSTELLAAQNAKDSQYTEELHFASNAGQQLTYLAGVFYLHVNRADNTFYTANPVPGTAFSFVTPPGATQTQNQEVLTESRAVFGEATYKLLDSLDLTAGGRFSSERRSGHSEITPFEASGPYSHTWSAFTPKGTVTFRPAPGILSYMTVSKGFQSGGFDAGAGTSAGLRTPFNPETVVSYELGLKAVAFDRRVTANLALYRADYSNLQRTQFDANPTVNSYRTTNAGKARVKGVEFDTSYLPVRWLNLGVTYVYTDGKYVDYSALQDNGTEVSYAGNTLPDTPKQQVHFSSELTLPFTLIRGDIIAGADYTYRSQIQFADANDTPQFILDKTRFNGMVNLHAGWQSESGHLVINAFAKNISDKRALTSFPDFTPYFANLAEFRDSANHIYLSRYSPKRLIGVTILVKF